MGCGNRKVTTVGNRVPLGEDKCSKIGHDIGHTLL